MALVDERQHLLADLQLERDAAGAIDLGAEDHRPGSPREAPRKFADKGLTVVMSTLAGGDCIDDVAALRAGATAAVLGQRVATAGRSAAARSSQRKIGRLCDQ